MGTRQATWLGFSAWLALLAGLSGGCTGRFILPPPPDHNKAKAKGQPAGQGPAPQASIIRTSHESSIVTLAGPHPVDYYVALALQRNPEIQAKEMRAAAQAETIPQVTALPDPMLSDTFWPIAVRSPQQASGRMPNSLMVSQQFPWLGKLRIRGQIADAETQIALTQLAEAQLKVIEGVKQAYYDIYFHQQAIAITLASDKILKDYIKSAEVRYTAGQASQQDILRAQVELSKLQDDLIQLRQQLRYAQADLAKLLSVSPEIELGAGETPGLPVVPGQVDLLYRAAVAYRPELQGQLQTILREQRAEELARLQYFPDVTVGVGWDAMSTRAALSPVADGMDNLGFLVSINLPIRQAKLRAGVREAQNRVLESARLYDNARDETFRLIKRLTVQAHALEQQITLFQKDIVPRSEQTLKVSVADYRVGKVPALQVFDNWTQFLRYQIQLVRLEATLGQTLAALERVLGKQLADLQPTPPALQNAPRNLPGNVNAGEPRTGEQPGATRPMRAVLLPPR